ncbi:MAG: hypothetical protein BWY82_00370 [Verrucomicrobia bacterium ADurb.Bin474]|nr:MAG: hypothetical protein BWY82_00370 [Verrucomicrobia bacterium ADurb.Bin474]
MNEPEFGRRQYYFPTINLHCVTVRVDAHSSNADLRRSFLRAPGYPFENGTNAQNQLDCVERLGDVVIRTGFQSFNAIGRVPLCSEKDDWNGFKIGVGPDHLAELDAV